MDSTSIKPMRIFFWPLLLVILFFLFSVMFFSVKTMFREGLSLSRKKPYYLIFTNDIKLYCIFSKKATLRKEESRIKICKIGKKVKRTQFFASFSWLQRVKLSILFVTCHRSTVAKDHPQDFSFRRRCKSRASCFMAVGSALQTFRS